MDMIEILVKHVWRVGFENLPPKVVLFTKKSIIDTLGVMIAGSSVKGCELLVDYIREWGGHPESTIAVFGTKVPCALAAQANGAMARAMELDDVSDAYPLHVTASVLPACMAVAERAGNVNGKQLITAVALGQDLAVRMALAMKLTPVVSGRYNLSQVFCYAALAAKLLGLTEEQALNAAGIGYHQMVGDIQALTDGVMTAYIQQGTRAKSAIEAALMAQKGITGTKDVLQGQFGFFHAYEPDPNLEDLTSGLGMELRGPELSVKLHSTCRFTHESIDLAQSFLSDGLDPDDIAYVKVRCADQPYKLVGQPVELKQKPETHVDAKFSIPYTTAAAFLRGDVFIEEVDEETIKDPKILDLAQRITPVVDPTCQSDIVLGRTVMEVTTRDGRTLRKEIQFPKGNPRNPASMDDCIAKFRKCVIYSKRPFPDGQLDHIVKLVKNLEQVEDASQLVRSLIPERLT